MRIRTALLLSLSLVSAIALIDVHSVSAQTATSSGVVISKNHQLYDKGADILVLQKFLNTHGSVVAQTGPGSLGNETSFFGLLTYRALKKFQKAQGLPSTGFLGPLTRGKLATSANIPAPTNPSTSPSNTPATTVSTTTVSIPQPYTPSNGYTPGYGGGSPDRTNPVISGTPSNTTAEATSASGATVSYTAPTATDNVDGTVSVSCTPASGSTFAIGATTVTCSTGDQAGNTSSSSFTVTVQDTTAPTASVTAPSNAATISGSTVTISGTASDVVGIIGVTFKIDSATVGSEDTSSPYGITFDSMTITNGSHSIVAVARDAAGNISTSTAATVTNSNYDYYVDSVNGSDSNTGLTSSQALQNLTALSTTTISDGQKIGLAAGSSWRQTLEIGTPSPHLNNITVAMYGSGAKPILDGADVISTGDWSKTGGFTNLYQATKSLPGIAGVWINIFEDGAFLRNVASQATADATACSYYIADMTAASAPLYIHACDGSNPASNGKTYEYTRRTLALQVWGNNETITNISTKRAAGNNGSLVVQGDGSASYISGCTADLGGKHNLFAPGGSTIDGCSFADEYYPSSGSMAVFFDGVGSGLPVTLKNSTFSQTQNITGNVVSAFYAHTGSGSHGAITIGTSTITATNGAKLSGIGGANAPSLLIDNIIASSTANLVTASINTTVTNSQIVSNYTTTSLLGTGASNVAVTISSTQACLSNIQHGIVVAQNVGASVTLTGNTFYVGATQTGIYSMLRSLAATTTLVANNNTLDSGKSNTRAWDFGSQAEATYTGDNNSFVSPNVNLWLLNGSTYTTLAQWRTASGQDANSVTTGSGISACTVRSL